MPFINTALTLKDLPAPPEGKTGWPWTEQSEPLPDKMPNGSEWSRISIVTPNYNYGQFLEETIRSVLLQGYPNLEYIIIDGGSTDNSVDIIKKYEPWLAYWVSEKDKGQANAINRGFTKATGEIFYWINSDDIIYPNVLKKISLFWLNHLDCHFLTGDGYFFQNSTETGRKITTYYIKSNAYSVDDLLEYHKNKYLPQPSVFFSKYLWEKTNGLNSELSFSMDLDFWLRARKLDTLYYIPECLSYLRLHDESKTCKQNVLLIQEVRKVLLKEYKNYNFYQELVNLLAINKFYAQVICQRSSLEYSLYSNKKSAGKLLLVSLLYWLPLIGDRLFFKTLLKIILPKNKIVKFAEFKTKIMKGIND